MAKRKKTQRQTFTQKASKAMRRAEREQRVAAMAEGRRERAVTFTDRKKERNRKACRGRVVH
jgi:hypothetical protein